MSFSSAYATVLNANTNRMQELRNQKQQNLTALQSGYIKDANGNWQANDLKQQDLDNKSQQLNLMKQELEATQKALKAQQSKSYADGISNITSDWITNNPEDALKTLRNTPGLKESLQNAKSLDFNDLDIVNFNNP